MPFEIDASTPLTGDVDIEALIANVPESHTMRGMFLAPLAGELGVDFVKLAPKLGSPPPSGKYLALVAYPSSDFFRLFDAVARRRHPSSTGREAYRLQAREASRVFASSMTGKAILSVIKDPAIHRRVLRELEEFVTAQPALVWRGSTESPML